MSASHGVAVSGTVANEVEVVAKATRRRFTAEYKLKILREAEACTQPGELGALLRREGLYSSNVTTWRGQREGIAQGQLTIHADHGSARLAKSVALLLADLGVTKTHSRPHVSNDNPFSESQFKTLKASPEFPDRFGALQDARSFLLDFFLWYNTMHHHSALGWLTPFDVHYGLAETRLAEREAVLRTAFAATPERFVRGLPQPPALPREVWINKPRTQEDVSETLDTKFCPEVSHSC